MIEIRAIDPESADYLLEIRLRNRVLREPLGLKLTDAELKPDAGDLHFGAFIEGKLVACLILARLAPERIRMRQVAVDATLQGTGIGRKLVEHAEKTAAETGAGEMVLKARNSAEGFYLRLGYQYDGAEEMQLGIPHRMMRKSLR